MRNRVALVLVVILAVAGSLFATGTKAKSMRSHGRQSVGTVAAVDDAAKSFTLKSEGADETIYWTEGTKVKGGALKADETVTVRWMEKDGKKIATSINIAAPKTTK